MKASNFFFWATIEKSKIYQFSEMKKGGHFAALEQPDIFVKDLRKFLRSLKYNPYSHNGRGGSL